MEACDAGWAHWFLDAGRTIHLQLFPRLPSASAVYRLNIDIRCNAAGMVIVDDSFAASCHTKDRIGHLVVIDSLRQLLTRIVASVSSARFVISLWFMNRGCTR